ncbi:hypothetical protein [Amycolatopsis sp. cmx-4-54]|uniref:hypothetical protein n=1 Tax=Amycolatopsis sp. cmx-4-54 TaxID=2790936 RepID=UPI0039795D90
MAEPWWKHATMIPVSVDPTFFLPDTPSASRAVTSDLAELLRAVVVPNSCDGSQERFIDVSGSDVREFVETSGLSARYGRLCSAVQLASLAVPGYTVPFVDDASDSPCLRRGRALLGSVFDARGSLHPLPVAGDPLVVAWQQGSGICVINLSARFVTVRPDWGAVCVFSSPVSVSQTGTLLGPASTVWLTRDRGGNRLDGMSGELS